MSIFGMPKNFKWRMIHLTKCRVQRKKKYPMPRRTRRRNFMDLDAEIWLGLKTSNEDKKQSEKRDRVVDRLKRKQNKL